MGKYFICLIVLQYLFLTINAQRLYSPEYRSPLLDKWRITHIEELKDKSIFDMDVSPDGTMFFTGKRNFYRYDGYNWNALLPDSLSKKIGWAVNNIIHAHDGVYLLQLNALKFYKDGSYTNLLQKDGIEAKFFYTNMLLLSNNNLIVSSGLGLYYFTPDRTYFYGDSDNLKMIKEAYPDFTVLPLPQEVIDNGFGSLYAFVEKNAEELWAFSGHYGILNIGYSDDVTAPLTFELQKENVRASNYAYHLITKSGDIWIGSESGSTPVYRYRNNQWTEYWPSKMFGVINKTSQMVEASDGSVLIGGVGYLIAIKDEKIEMYTREHLPLPDEVIKLQKDKNNNIWLGSLEGKYYVIDYNSSRWARYEDLFYQFESNDSIWFLSKDNKVVVNHKNKWFCFGEADGLIDAPVRIIKTSKGHIWCAGSHKGVAATAYLRENTWKKQTHPEFAWGIHKRSVFEDSQGNLWFGAVKFHKGLGGVMKLSYEDLAWLKWQHVEISDVNARGSSEIVGGIAEGDDGTIYFATFKTVYQLKKEDKHVTIANFIANCPVQQLVTVNKKNLWLGTAREGLINWSKDEKIKHGIGKGLVSNFVVAVYPESENKLWIATDEEVSFYNGTNWINNCMPQELVFKSASSEINGNRDKNEIWISIIPKEWSLRASTHANTYGDLFSVRYVRDTHPPETKITHFEEEVDQSGNTYIAWSAVDYWNATGQEELMYSYKLNDREWTGYSYEKGKSFSRLTNGKYTLQVRSKDKEFNVDQSPAVVQFRVLPPVYKRPWFIAMVIIFVIITIVLVINIVVRNKKLGLANNELKEQQEEIVTQNEEIQQQNEEIQQQNEEMLTVNEQLEKQKMEISESYRRLEVLSEFGQKITTTLSISSINDMIYHYVKSILHVDAFGIGLHNAQENIIVYPVFHNGKVKKEVVKDLNDSCSLTAWCFNNQKPVFINDFEREFTDYLEGIPVEQLERQSQSRIHLPLTVEKKRIGIIVINSDQKNEYSKEDLTNFQTLASYISIALDNAKAYEVINNINQNVKERITYAKSIQTAFLPTHEELNKYLTSEILFKPKDIVSGDFYWFSALNSKKEEPLKALLCVADCTGHGVPGALVSSIGNNLLNEVINIKKVHDPAKALELVNEGFQNALNQKETGNNDGMDMALVLVEEVPDKSSQISDLPKSKESICYFKITFSGAKNPLVIYREKTDELEYIKGSRKSIGGIRAWRSKVMFEDCKTTVSTGDVLYLFTDGIVDQHSDKRERYTRERLFSVLKAHGDKPIASLMQFLDSDLESHGGKSKQTDDITFMAVKV